MMYPCPQPGSEPSARRGFTLVEVLVATMITSIVILMLFRILVGAMDAWRGGTGKMQSNADARMALDLIARDLESMVVRQTSATVNQEWLVSRPDLASPPGGTVTNTWMVFFAPSIDRDPTWEGDICAVSYKVAFLDPVSTDMEVAPSNMTYAVLSLYKNLINPSNTFHYVLGASDIMTNPGNPAQVAWSQVNPTRPMDFLIPNVISFKVDWWVRDFTASQNLHRIGREHEVRLGNALRVKPLPPGVPQLGQDANGYYLVNGKLEAVDISLTLMDEEGAKQLRLGIPPSTLRQKFGRHYTKRVRIEY